MANLAEALELERVGLNKKVLLGDKHPDTVKSRARFHFTLLNQW